MAISPDPKKPAPANARMAEIQKRAERMATRKPVPASQFFKEAWVELKKTTWPTREVLARSTTVVLALVVSVGIYMGGLDYIFSKLMNPLFGGH